MKEHWLLAPRLTGGGFEREGLTYLLPSESDIAGLPGHTARGRIRHDCPAAYDDHIGVGIYKGPLYQDIHIRIL